MQIPPNRTTKSFKILMHMKERLYFADGRANLGEFCPTPTMLIQWGDRLSKEGETYA